MKSVKVSNKVKNWNSTPYPVSRQKTKRNLVRLSCSEVHGRMIWSISSNKLRDALLLLLQQKFYQTHTITQACSTQTSNPMKSVRRLQKGTECQILAQSQDTTSRYRNSLETTFRHIIDHQTVWLRKYHDR